MITVIGLGCGAGSLSEEAHAALCAGARVILRTEQTPPAAAVLALGVPCASLDGVYASCRNFDTLNKKLAAAVLGAAKEGDVVYCVDGSVTEDVSAQIVCRRDKSARILDGVPKSTAAFAAARVFARGGCARSAYALAEGGRPAFPLAVYDVDCELVASDVKLWLCDLVGDEADGFFVCGGKAKKIKVFEIDRMPAYDSTCAVVVGEIPLLEKRRFSFDDLMDVLRRLRAPDGCPWDRAQTHESIRGNMIEEAYELVDAVDSGEDSKICEEAGDVLMQGAFHALIAEERGAFGAGDVLSDVCRKLIFRHSHIFGKDRAENAEGALSVWDKNKDIEKGHRTASDSVRDVPKAFPAVLRAQKVGKRAAKVGYDFANVQEAAKRVSEETEELLSAVAAGDKAHIAEEAGDLLFSAVNVGRLAGADCEEALRASTDKFVRRFCAVEAAARADGRELGTLTPAEMWKYYDKVKADERG